MKLYRVAYSYFNHVTQRKVTEHGPWHTDRDYTASVIPKFYKGMAIEIQELNVSSDVSNERD